MTDVDPRVQRARELLQGTIRADHESEEARSVIHDLLAVVDELRELNDENDSLTGLLAAYMERDLVRRAERDRP